MARKLIFSLLLFIPSLCCAHGGVAFSDDDVCIINIDFLTAHFTIFQPEETKRDEYCEDIPNVSESIFVLEYLHDYLQEMPVEFRIIKDVNNYGFFAQWQDIEAMGDLEDATVFYQGPTLQPEGVYSVNHTFTEPGVYIGIVTAFRPEDNMQYHAVFPFKVGTNNWGIIPLFVILIVVAQFAYWKINKNLKSG